MPVRSVTVLDSGSGSLAQASYDWAAKSGLVPLTTRVSLGFAGAAGRINVNDPKVMSLPKVSKGSDPAEVAKAVRRRVVQSLGGDTAVLATAVDPRCAFAVMLRYTSRVARLLHTAVSGDGLYKAVLEPKFDLTLARMASERSLRTFVVWPPVVHLQRDDDDTPTDGYGGNSSRFIEAYLGMDE